MRADALAGNIGTLNVFLHGGQVKFGDISGSIAGVTLSSVDNSNLLIA